MVETYKTIVGFETYKTMVAARCHALFSDWAVDCTCTFALVPTLFTTKDTAWEDAADDEGPTNRRCVPFWTYGFGRPAPAATGWTAVSCPLLYGRVAS